MIVRTFSESPVIKLFDGGLAHSIINDDDAVGHTLIEARIRAGVKTAAIATGRERSYDVQAYYCIAGDGVMQLGETDYSIKPGTLIASGIEKRAVLTANSDMRIAAIFCANGVRNAPVVVRDLERIHGTERDVFWGNGQSKRMLVKNDGFGFAFCVTFGNSNTDSLLQYRNNLESCYYIAGSGEYEWELGRHPILTDSEEGTVFIMNKYDTHNMRIKDQSICLSIFTPPIEGNESHDFSSGKPSSY